VSFPIAVCILEIVSSSAEFESVPIRHHEDVTLRRIYDRVPVKLDNPNFSAPYFKTFLLLQAHFSRLQLPPDLAADQSLVLSRVLNLLAATVDVMSSNAYLNATGAMDLSQMCVQGVWEADSPLKQIPHFDLNIIRRCNDAGIETLYDLMEMEDDQRDQLLQMEHRQMRDVATFVNSYPNLDVSHELQRQDEYNSSTPLVLSVTLTRDIDESDADDGQTVVSPLYPSRKMVNWWLVIGNPSIRQLLSIRKVTVRQEITVKLEFNLPRGEHKLKLYVICDSYLGADHDINLDPITVVEGEESDSGEELESSDD